MKIYAVKLLQLDIFYLEYVFAIEVQEQHEKYIEFFHKDDFIKQQSFIMTETAGQILGHTVPVCQWILQNLSNLSSTAPAYPWFPNNMREWTGFFRAVRLAGMQFSLPGGQFLIGFTNAVPLKVEDEAKTHLYNHILNLIKILLILQGAFVAIPARFLETSVEDSIQILNSRKESYRRYLVKWPVIASIMVFYQIIAIRTFLRHVAFNNFLSNDDDDDDTNCHDPDDDDDPDYYPDDSDNSDDDDYVSLGKRKRT
ncbi:hypothetical protein C1645_821232 [Glomus cerebriforme]|uniref:Uncharacterized protein n=1 Tax=Glomus cerebriforme TaxID=658196 RepID=A0A397TAQ0_9GLOM|nr:hypothetical protein C1645_821232 [Glomus cerebriforme]